VHRRCLHDDGRGVGEPLNETGQFGDGLIIRGKHLVLLDNYVNSTVYQRLLGEMLMLEPMQAFMPSTDSPSDYMEKYFTDVRYSAYAAPHTFILLTSVPHTSPSPPCLPYTSPGPPCLPRTSPGPPCLPRTSPGPSCLPRTSPGPPCLPRTSPGPLCLSPSLFPLPFLSLLPPPSSLLPPPPSLHPPL